jgi:hypothetical protein
MDLQDLPRRFYSTPTGDLSNPADAMHLLRDFVPETGGVPPHVAVLELRGKLFSPASLRDLIVRLGQQVRGGTFGDLKLVLVASDPATREIVGLLAQAHSLPIYLASSYDPSVVEEALPVGDLTPAEVQTIEQLRLLGGLATAARVAELMDLEPSAATNRLVNVERKGYLHRIKRTRPQGDLFVDPRTRRQAISGGGSEDLPKMREALLDAGIRANPYEGSRLKLEGEAARRAQQIIRGEPKE